ncbi:hypothetical protein AB0E59_35910 [Lentzea sp. NPDC034063]|uniref:hypothetical protein n=1 Tax=unclassified Lentzea TaxID=2643253 RepID=UPI0033CE4D8B
MLRERWSRSRRYITAFSVILPGLQVLLCTAIVMLNEDDIVSSSAIALIPVAIAAVALRQWLRRQAPLDPSVWLLAAAFTAGVQLLSSAIPAYGIATSITSEAQVTPSILFCLCWVVAVATGLSAHLAAQALLVPLVPELGSADLRLTLPVRAVVEGSELVSARITIERDRVEWTVRLPVSGDGKAKIDMSVPFRELLQVTPVQLPVVPEQRPWITLPGGITLYAQAGPAVLLTATHDQRLMPVHDAELVAELINRRRALWSQGRD